MRVMTLLGTRPEIIRLSLVIERLNACCEHTVVHTGQNFDDRLSRIFFQDLGIATPDHYLNVAAGSSGAQIARILEQTESVLESCRPDRILILGDTNSALSALIAARRGIPVFHMEAGNRCYDDRVPEEINRRVVDQCSDVLMPYTERARENLLREGFRGERIFVTGNPIGEVIARHQEGIERSGVLGELELEASRYFLVTLHRAENVDHPQRLTRLLSALEMLEQSWGFPVIVSAHPRLRARLGALGSKVPGNLQFHPPFGFLDFLHLQQNAFCVLSDSGTVQEECVLLRVPSVTLRDVTERPETLECGGAVLAGSDPQSILRATGVATQSDCQWPIPAEYQRRNTAETVTRLVTGHHDHFRLRRDTE